ncbi:hypothetical protein CcCBS67573_g09543 [Chytriomyces confervae]|uniref:Uncharacterized protein n=1 Tax=Chytriomyces confervae TaxID=246404 RepID=A0A507DU61_9FUNG|nr:hypothetical protein CcCBS67573_g09543 [Chytriomyces confervae]
MSVVRTLKFTFWMTVTCTALSGVGYVVMASTMGDEKVIAAEVGRSEGRVPTDDERRRNQAIVDMIKNSRENGNDTPFWRNAFWARRRKPPSATPNSTDPQVDQSIAQSSDAAVDVVRAISESEEIANPRPSMFNVYRAQPFISSASATTAPIYEPLIPEGALETWTVEDWAMWVEINKAGERGAESVHANEMDGRLLAGLDVPEIVARAVIAVKSPLEDPPIYVESLSSLGVNVVEEHSKVETDLSDEKAEGLVKFIAGKAWPAGLVLAEYFIWRLQNVPLNCSPNRTFKMLELGAGTGVTSLFVGKTLQTLQTTQQVEIYVSESMQQLQMHGIELDWTKYEDT